MQRIVVMGLLSGLLSFIGVGNKSNPTFEQQLGVFKQLGFELNPGISISDINRWSGGFKEFEEQPFSLMYMTLGQTIEREPWTPITNKCWDFDLEAIGNTGDYIKIMKNIGRITNGELIFENLADFIDIEKGVAWVSFKCNGENYKWDLKVNKDWADGDLFDKVQALAVRNKTKGKFTFFNTGGQDFVLGFSSQDDLNKIVTATGLKIEWLNAKGQIY